MIKKRNGFTLIEIIMVIIVLGIASYGVLTIFINALRGSAYPLQGVQAVELAKEKLEIIMADKYASPTGYSDLITANYPNEAPVAGFPEFNRSAAFAEVDGNDLTTASPGSGFMKITVTVSWGVADSVSLETVATDY